MNYIGSKKKLIAFIKETVYEEVGYNLKEQVFCDLFAGSGAVGRAFKKEVKAVISNDLEYFSYVLNRHCIANCKKIECQDLFDELNALDGVEGFIFRHYAKNTKNEREYFSAQNAKKIDAMRERIEHYYSCKRIDEDSYFYLLSSLIASADKVANTASVYGSYLKYLKPLAQKKLILEPSEYELTNQSNRVYNTDASELIVMLHGDILYVDPPYNVRQYGADYHLLNTIALYDEFTPQGKTGRREYNRSNFCKKNGIKNALEELIKNAKFRYVFMSYSSDGILSSETIANLMKQYGTYRCKSMAHKYFGQKKSARTTVEYLHIVKKW
ncbi:MAG: DNA adenine methylase [Campylobacterota bacterium]|nr:DNA adenine methylase [Campylobacterota bacterium]